MLTILIRTVLIYILLHAMLRLMGKRQLGELEVTELISTLLLSELATFPIENAEIPVLFALIPITVIVSLEIILSFIKNKSRRLKRLLEGVPSILIERGKLRQSELRHLRLSAEEFLGELRLQGVTRLSDVYYAILEPNGQLSVILRKECQPITPQDLNIPQKETGISHTLVIDGAISTHELKVCNKTEEWLRKKLKEEGATLQNTFLFSIDDAGKTTFIPKERS